MNPAFIFITLLTKTKLGNWTVFRRMISSALEYLSQNGVTDDVFLWFGNKSEVLFLTVDTKTGKFNTIHSFKTIIGIIVRAKCLVLGSCRTSFALLDSL